MSGVKETLKNYPDISFIENLTLKELKDNMITDFEEKYKEITGKEKSLGLADPYRLILYAASLQIYQAFQYLDDAGKQSFLKYSREEFLDNLGALKGIKRSKGTAAVTTMRFLVSEPQKNAIIIPIGTKCTAGDNIFFYTTETAEISRGELYADVVAECAEKGEFANGYAIGKINKMVDVIPYIESVQNITITEKGSEIETDENLAERIHMAQSSYSVAGPEDAYIYWVKTFIPSAEDVKITSPAKGAVNIRFTMQDGEIPGKTTIEELQQKIGQRNIRPLTDKVEVSAPDIADYEILFTYWIEDSNRNKAELIQENVKEAVKAYQRWQSNRIGRDINPNKLITLLVEAGVKRAEITEPKFKAITDTSIARLRGEPEVVFGGVEDD